MAYHFAEEILVFGEVRFRQTSGSSGLGLDSTFGRDRRQWAEALLRKIGLASLRIDMHTPYTTSAPAPTAARRGSLAACRRRLRTPRSAEPVAHTTCHRQKRKGRVLAIHSFACDERASGSTAPICSKQASSRLQMDELGFKNDRAAGTAAAARRIAGATLAGTTSGVNASGSRGRNSVDHNLERCNKLDGATATTAKRTFGAATA